ncbi:MAG: elongation factor G [Clostridia bacterium]|nr:elongation factor G [Oscillospiraceae bacterium]MBQ7005578.1 elongation factor G [Clostridia bacterium]
MKAYTVNNIRNIAIAGHTGKGKTALSEAMLYVAGVTDRLGKVADGNTIMDYDAEEKKRKCSISAACASLEWRDTKINILDAPGKFDFAGGMAEAMRAADCAVIVTSAGSGVDVGLEKAIKAADARKLAKFFVITKVDSENRDFYKTFEALKAELGNKLCPVVVPYMNGPVCEAFVNLCSNKAFKYPNGRPQEIDLVSDENILNMRAALEEAVATVDEELMEKFFEGEPLTKEEIINGLTKGVETGEIWPVYACSATKVDGCDMLLDAIVYSAPSPDKAEAEIATDENGEETEVECKADAPLAAICYKTIADPFVGKMSFVKVLAGKITPDTPAFNSRTGETERMGKLVSVKGIKQEDVKEITTGDIGVITKLSGLATGDTLCTAKKPITLAGVNFPAPSLSMAVVVKKKGEEDKVASGLRKIIAEDPTVSFVSNDETKEMVLSGLGEQHLEVVVSKLKAKYGVEIDLKIPKVAYRETIRKSCQVQGRHKKQSGGSGQFGDVFIRFEPHTGDELIFETEVVGGSVPKNFFPAVEKGLQEAILKGPLAGYPMVGLKAVLYDGSYHPVDSNEMAFKTAAKIAYKNGMAQANPVILEPIGELKAYMPDANLGDIMGDITKRRGRVLGMGAADEPKMQELVAEVPMAEMGDFSTTLRSVTAGRGYFTLEFARYEDAPSMVAQKVIEEAKKDMED